MSRPSGSRRSFEWDARFVNYVEVAEFDRIEACGSDRAIDLVKKQIRELYRTISSVPSIYIRSGTTPAMNAANGTLITANTTFASCREPGHWRLWSVRSATCGMSSGGHSRPLSFRAGNWLFQPSATAADVLSESGIKIDSSVFKGGVQHNHSLDYRPAQSERLLLVLQPRCQRAGCDRQLDRGADPYGDGSILEDGDFEARAQAAMPFGGSAPSDTSRPPPGFPGYAIR